MQIAGVQLRPMPRPQSCEALRRALVGTGQNVVVTVNPEMIVQASKDSLFRSIIHRAHLHLVDGAGLVFVSRLKGFRGVERFTGVDAVDYVCSVASDMQKRVFLLGTGSTSILLSAANHLRSKYPSLIICGMHAATKMQEFPDGVVVSDEGKHDDLINTINKAQPDVLFVALGHGKQEKWIHQFRGRIPSVKLFMGVGGALDFMGGAVKRAPELMQKWGLEWLFRLIVEPRRWRRIWRATIVFLWKAK